jgi:hypothetical protein
MLTRDYCDFARQAGCIHVVISSRTREANMTEWDAPEYARLSGLQQAMAEEVLSLLDLKMGRSMFWMWDAAMGKSRQKLLFGFLRKPCRCRFVRGYDHLCIQPIRSYRPTQSAIRSG